MDLPDYRLLSPQQVAFRAICLSLSIQNYLIQNKVDPLIHFHHTSRNGNNHQAENISIISRIQSSNIFEYLICTKDYLSATPPVIRSWAVDQLEVYLWVLGITDRKPIVSTTFCEDESFSYLPFSGNLKHFICQARLRSIEELYCLEQALDIYDYRATVLMNNYGFSEGSRKRLMKKATALFSQAFIIDEPTDDLNFLGRPLVSFDKGELESIHELCLRRTLSLFYVLGKMHK